MLELFKDVHLQYMSDPKAISSLAVFLTSLIAAGFVIGDIFAKQTRVPQIWKSTLVTMCALKLSLAVYGGIRFFDALEDAQFLVDNPGAVSTLSQRTWLLEIPFLGVAITMLVFILVYSSAYFKNPKIKEVVCTEEEKRNG